MISNNKERYNTNMVPFGKGRCDMSMVPLTLLYIEIKIFKFQNIFKY